MKIMNCSSYTEGARFSHPNWIRWMVWLLVVSLLLLPLDSARADIGPKPTMEFVFIQETDLPLTIVEGTLLECADETCTQAEPLEELGPQGFSCTQDACSSMAYGYSEYHRLVIRFSDGKVRESNIFRNRFFDASYTVTVRTDDLVVEEDVWRSSSASSLFFAFILGLCGIPVLLIAAIGALTWLSIRARKDELLFSKARGAYIFSWLVSVVMIVAGGLFSLTLPLTVVIETILAAGYAKLRQRPILTVLTLVILVNSITQPALFFTLSIVDTRGQVGMLVFLLFLEIFIWLGEAIMLYLPQKKEITFKETLGLSFLLNTASFLIGLFLRV